MNPNLCSLLTWTVGMRNWNTRNPRFLHMRIKFLTRRALSLHHLRRSWHTPAPWDSGTLRALVGERVRMSILAPGVSMVTVASLVSSVLSSLTFSLLKGSIFDNAMIVGNRK